MGKELGSIKRMIKGTSLTGVGDSGNPSVAEVADGRIIRIRPYDFNEQYSKEASENKWTIQARGRKLEAPARTPISPFGLTYKTRVYSRNRVKYPLKRVDWDPKGERHPETRGISKYVRISWEEAAQIAADELIRMRDTYGMSSVLVESDGHAEGKHAAYKGCPNRLVGLVGPYTVQVRNMDSWEGWHLGARHVWGCEPLGEMSPSANLFPDIAEHSDTVLYWGCDSEVTPLGITSCLPSKISYFFTTIGIKSVFIDPSFNYAAAVHADKWIPIMPDTDAAFQLAIAYIWLTEGTYDKDYIAKHAYGFDKFTDYVLGKEDGTPKTPAWASEKCGVSEWTIKAFARKWAKDVTSILHGNGGGYIRGPYATEPARLEVMLLGMQGLGAPGVHQAKMLEWDCFVPGDFAIPYQSEEIVHIPQIGSSDVTPAVDEDLPLDPECRIGYQYHAPSPEVAKRSPGFARLTGSRAPVAQCVPRCLVQRALLEERLEWYGCAWSPAHQAEDPALPTPHRHSTAQAQFHKYEFPRPGCSRIHMIWTDSPCNVTCWNAGNTFIKGYRSEGVETIIAQHPWMENDCCFADLILPVATKFEMNDIGNDTSSGTYMTVYKEDRCCEPIGESKDDFWCCAEVAKKLGPDVYEKFTGNYTPDELVKMLYDAAGIEKFMSWEELGQKQLCIIPRKKHTEDILPGLRVFHDDPGSYKLTTPSGLLEYSSGNMEKFLPDDMERPPVPHWIESGPAHDERLGGERGKKYTLLLVSNHGRWRMHAQCDDIIWNREVETMKVKGWDGYSYEPCWLNPREAEKRGIRTGDIVKVYNERGVVLCGAYVTERIADCSCYVDHGARLDPIIPGWLDRGGAINTLSPLSNTSSNATGMATSGYLVEVEKVTSEEMEGWKRDYPTAFGRKIDPACGICLDGWLASD